MWNHAFQTVLYEIAVKHLTRVSLKDRPGVIGLVLQEDELAGTVQIHWGVSDRQVFQSWHKKEELDWFNRWEVDPLFTPKSEEESGHWYTRIRKEES